MKAVLSLSTIVYVSCTPMRVYSATRCWSTTSASFESIADSVYSTLVADAATRTLSAWMRPSSESTCICCTATSDSVVVMHRMTTTLMVITRIGGGGLA
jgi:hypothetical protein